MSYLFDVQEEWNHTASVYPRNSTVHELFENTPAQTPKANAVVDGTENLTYVQLNERANQLARYLRSRGVDREALVGIALERSISMIVCMLGVLKAGAAYLPLDSTYPAERLKFMLDDAQPTVLLTDRSRRNAYAFATIPVICLDEDQPEINRQSTENLPLQTAAEGLAYVMYTSGSTGTPKGAEIPHRGIVRLVRDTNYVTFAPGDIVAQISNASFDAITFEVWGALLNGALLTILPTEIVLSPRRFAAAIREQRISTMFLTAALFKLMASHAPDAFGGLKHLVVGGDAVDPEAARKVLKTAPPGRLVNGYGPTEATTFSVCHLIEDVPEGASAIPIGKPISNSQAYIVDSSLQQVPIGEPGELYLGGDGLARGYRNRPELNRERFVRNPFDAGRSPRLYRTGDMARYRPDGVIEFLGRADHQIKLRGYRIELGEIEMTLRQHPAVADCVVVPAEEALVAYAATSGESRPTGRELRSFLCSKLPEFMIPKTVVTMDALPLTPAGKLDRSALPSPTQISGTRTEFRTESSTELQSWLLGVWTNLLGIQNPGLDDNFFDCGGDSLKLATVEAEIRTRLDREISITELFAYPTIRSLSSRLERSAPPSVLREQTQERARKQGEYFQRQKTGVAQRI
jgi:amino acid adenylation domain-containing protein